MLTVGVDLAAEPATTAVAAIEWLPGRARVTGVDLPADDAVVLWHAEAADKVGIDCPLGWPDAFVDFLHASRDDPAAIPTDLAGAVWRRSLAYRRTDEHVRASLGLVPLSVATDRIGLTAMRAARLHALLARRGHRTDRAGTGLLVEVYPAAGLKHWGLPYRRYKGTRHRDARGDLIDRFTAQAHWLHLGDHDETCRRSDHAIDAVLAAVLARAAACGLTVPPAEADAAAAATEGWIAVPTGTLDDLAP